MFHQSVECLPYQQRWVFHFIFSEKMIFFIGLMVYENGKETVYKMQFFLVGQRIHGQSTHRTINKMLRKMFGEVRTTNQV